VIMIAVLIEQQVRDVLNWSFASALATVLLIVTIAIYGLAQRATGERAAPSLPSPASGGRLGWGPGTARSLRRRARPRRLALALVCAPIFVFLILPLVVVF